MPDIIMGGVCSYEGKEKKQIHGELTTLTLEIYAIVNNRPLMDLSCHPDSPLMPTPSI